MKLKRWHRRFITALLVSVSICWFVLSPLGADLFAQGLVVFLPADTGAPTEAIVVLGRGEALRDSRIQTVADLWFHHRAGKIFASGMNDAKEIVNSLADQGVPRVALEGERCSQSTAENALFTATLLQPQQIRSILLVTDPSHILRSVLVFRALGFDVIPHPTSDPTQANPKKKLLSVLREYAGLIGYAFDGQFKSPSASTKQAAMTRAALKIKNWKCHVQLSDAA